jgi:hypothetical protein
MVGTTTTTCVAGRLVIDIGSAGPAEVVEFYRERFPLR